MLGWCIFITSNIKKDEEIRKRDRFRRLVDDAIHLCKKWVRLYHNLQKYAFKIFLNVRNES